MIINDISALIFSASEGDALSQYKLGLYYRKGSEEHPSDWVEAATWFKLAAKQGNIEAQYQLGSLYSMGLKGISKNIKDSIKWFELASKQGHTLSQYHLARLLYESDEDYKDKQQAIKYFEKIAENQFTKLDEQSVQLESQLQLGLIFLHGDGDIKQDYKTALKWYKKAAEKGSEEAQYSLGVMYENGQGVGVDLDESIKWFQLSAEQDAEDAQFALGLIFYKKKEYINSYKWLKIANKNEHKQAKEVLDLLTKNMSKKEIDQAENLADILIKNGLGLLE